MKTVTSILLLLFLCNCFTVQSRARYRSTVSTRDTTLLLKLRQQQAQDLLKESPQTNDAIANPLDEPALSLLKRNAAAAKVFVMGDNYMPDNETWGLLGTKTFEEQCQLLHEILSGSSLARKAMINDAFMVVYGRIAAAGEISIWSTMIGNDKHLCFYSILDSERRSLATDTTKRKTVIFNLYHLTLAREPTLSEIRARLLTPGDFAEMHRILLEWLYSSAGKKDLVKISRLSYGSKACTPAQLEIRMTQSNALKLDYTGMMTYYQR